MSTTKVAIVGVTGVALCLGGYFYYQYRREKTDKKKIPNNKKKKTTKSQKQQHGHSHGHGKNSLYDEKKEKESGGRRNIPQPKELSHLVHQALTELTERNVNDKDRELLEYLKSTRPSDMNPRNRLEAAQYILVYYTKLASLIESEQDYKDFVAKQSKDHHVTWAFLEMKEGLDEKEEAEADVLRLDIALRMRDKHKLLPVYEKLIARDDKSDEETVIAFTVAPTLGRWQDLIDLGDKIMVKTKSLQNFHNAAIQRQDIPDYEMLYKLADTQEESHKMDDIFWQGYKIKSMKIKLVDVEASEDEMKKIRDSFNAQTEDGFKDLPLSDNRLLRVGAFAQMISPSAFPIPLAGPATRNSIILQGYADINPDKPQRQTESYDLKKENEEKAISTWTGTYVVKQEDIKKSKEPITMLIRFQCKVVLEEIGSDELI